MFPTFFLNFFQTPPTPIAWRGHLSDNSVPSPEPRPRAGAPSDWLWQRQLLRHEKINGLWNAIPAHYYYYYCVAPPHDRIVTTQTFRGPVPMQLLLHNDSKLLLQFCLRISCRFQCVKYVVRLDLICSFAFRRWRCFYDCSSFYLPTASGITCGCDLCIIAFRR